MDIAAVQALFAQARPADAHRPAPGRGRGARRGARRAAGRPAGRRADRGAGSGADQAANLSRAYRVNLTMLAAIALLTGGFLVFSAQALSVVRRRTEFAFLRALGLPATAVRLAGGGGRAGRAGGGRGRRRRSATRWPGGRWPCSAATWAPGYFAG